MLNNIDLNDWKFEQIGISNHESKYLSTKCGFYDLRQNEIMETTPLKYEINIENEGCCFSICENNQYHTDKIYALSDVGHLAQFNIETEVWDVLW